MNTLILDNYDSFTFNFYQYVGELGGNPVVHRNNKITIEEVREMNPTHIVLSPGPGNPWTERDIGIGREVIGFAQENSIPLLGVCLGHQTLVHHLGGIVERAPSILHGKASSVSLEQESTLFTGIESPFSVMRYHSLCATTLPDSLVCTAKSDDGVVMAVEHTDLPFYGVQFHPESIGTKDGKTMLRNFLTEA